MKSDLTMVGERTHLLRIERINSLGAGDVVGAMPAKKEGRPVPPPFSQQAGQPQLRSAILAILCRPPTAARS
jgi:hypothetical protein